MTKKSLKSIFSKPSHWIALHVGLAVVFVVVLMIVANSILSAYTQHGKELVVPDFTGLTFSEAQAVAAGAGVKVVEGDSVYVRQMRSGGVLSQNPAPGASVKQGRCVTLVTNSRAPKKIAMPSLIGLSMNMAKTDLISRGLVLGNLVYVNDIATNNVIRQQYRGEDIAAGDMIQIGSVIDLVVGLNESENKAHVPSLVGKKYNRAVEMIHESSLNVGRVDFDRSVKTYSDTLNAVVWRQNPSEAGEVVGMGTRIDIKLTVDESKLAQ